MSNVTSLYNNRTAVSGFYNNGYGAADFEIDTAPLTYSTYDRLDIPSSKKVIYRTDTSEELGVHGSKYKPVAPKRMIDSTRSILERSDLDLTDAVEDIQTSHGGSRTFVQYDLPHHTYETPDGDTACLSLLAITSFDSTWPFMISVAAKQAACLNLQVFVSGEVAVYKSKHTKGLDVDRGSRIIMNALGIFEKEKELWYKWQNTSTSNAEVLKVFADAVNSEAAKKLLKEKPFISTLELLGSLPRANNNLNYLIDVYKNTYVPRLGNNQWALYNALTDWSTHAPASRSSKTNIASVSNTRQRNVRAALQSNLYSKAA